jgi:hypothetical protein
LQRAGTSATALTRDRRHAGRELRTDTFERQEKPLTKFRVAEQPTPASLLADNDMLLAYLPDPAKCR